MNFTIICPNCGTRLTLFDSQIKAQKGAVRCTRCGNRVRYDLTKPGAGQPGFWPETAVPFKPGAQNRFLSIAKARKDHPDFQGFSATPAPEATDAPRIPPAFSRSQDAFQKFDLKTGTVLPKETVSTESESPTISHSEIQTAPTKTAPVSRPSKAQPKSTARKAPKKSQRIKSTLPKIPKQTELPNTKTGKTSFLSRLTHFFRKLFK